MEGYAALLSNQQKSKIQATSNLATSGIVSRVPYTHVSLLAFVGMLV
jgi:hypothetical protein